MAEWRMTEVERRDLVDLVDREHRYHHGIEPAPSVTFGQVLDAVLAADGWLVVRPVDQEPRR